VAEGAETLRASDGKWVFDVFVAGYSRRRAAVLLSEDPSPSPDPKR
jgi:hypothetical protein